MDEVEIFIDGVCKGNLGLGGWGVLLCYNGYEKILKGVEVDIINNCMEFIVVLEVLCSLKCFCKVDLIIDFQYVRKGIMEWIYGWKKKGWKNVSK